MALRIRGIHDKGNGHQGEGLILFSKQIVLVINNFFNLYIYSLDIACISIISKFEISLLCLDQTTFKGVQFIWAINSGLLFSCASQAFALPLDREPSLHAFLAETVMDWRCDSPGVQVSCLPVSGPSSLDCEE